MQLLDGKKVSEEIKNEIAAEVAKMKAKGEKVPHLAAIIVGNDGASLTYVGSKVKACERVGFESTLIKMPSTTSETELLKKIKELNVKLIPFEYCNPVKYDHPLIAYQQKLNVVGQEEYLLYLGFLI